MVYNMKVIYIFNFLPKWQTLTLKQTLMLFFSGEKLLRNFKFETHCKISASVYKKATVPSTSCCGQAKSIFSRSKWHLWYKTCKSSSYSENRLDHHNKYPKGFRWLIFYSTFSRYNTNKSNGKCRTIYPFNLKS